MFKRLIELPRSLLKVTINLLRPDIPKFDPTQWSPTDDVQYDNNCYNYACDIPGTYAQPGLSSGNKYAHLTCREVGRALVADGLVPIDCANACRRGYHQVALVIWPEKSFHLYRRDRNGLWSHKLGDGPPTNLDYSGNIIRNPRTANRGPFTVFCGCYCVNKNRVSIK